MSTNFYAVKILPREDKKAIILKILNDDYDGVKEDLLMKSKKIHLGKLSNGWKFLFNPNNGMYYDFTRKSINEYISSSDCKIFDEYKNEVTVKDFWGIVDSNADGLDSEKYFSEHDGEAAQWAMYDSPYWCSYSNYNPKYSEFFSDNLRFSVYDKFS